MLLVRTFALIAFLLAGVGLAYRASDLWPAIPLWLSIAASLLATGFISGLVPGLVRSPPTFASLTRPGLGGALALGVAFLLVRSPPSLGHREFMHGDVGILFAYPAAWILTLVGVPTVAWSLFGIATTCGARLRGARGDAPRSQPDASP